MAARRVVLRGTWLVKVSPSCCILHCPGPGVACSLFRSALSISGSIRSQALYLLIPFTNRGVPLPTELPQAFRNLPHTNFVRRNCPQSAASLRRAPQASAPGAAKISMLRAEIILLGFHKRLIQSVNRKVTSAQVYESMGM